MKLYGKCSKCSSEITFRKSQNTRVELAMYEGELQIIKCGHCNTKVKLHVNDIYTKQSKLAIGLASIIFLVGTPLIIYFLFISKAFNNGNPYHIVALASFFLIPIIIYIIIHKQERLRVNAFNRLYL